MKVSGAQDSGEKGGSPQGWCWGDTHHEMGPISAKIVIFLAA